MHSDKDRQKRWDKMKADEGRMINRCYVCKFKCLCKDFEHFIDIGVDGCEEFELDERPE